MWDILIGGGAIGFVVGILTGIFGVGDNGIWEIPAKKCHCEGGGRRMEGRIPKK